MDPVSPELVLVDPELAQAERARLASRDNVVGPVGDRTVSTAARPAPAFQRAQAIARESAYTKSRLGRLL